MTHEWLYGRLITEYRAELVRRRGFGPRHLTRNPKLRRYTA